MIICTLNIQTVFNIIMCMYAYLLISYESYCSILVCKLKLFNKVIFYNWQAVPNMATSCHYQKS